MKGLGMQEQRASVELVRIPDSRPHPRPTASFFFLFFFPALLRYNGRMTLCKFKAYNVMI